MGGSGSTWSAGSTRATSRTDASRSFDRWLTSAVQSAPRERDAQLAQWMDAPAARLCHPRSEHLMPLFVAAGAGADDRGRRTYEDDVLGAKISAYAFG